MASPVGIGPWATASRSISAPPALLIAPATPAPIHRWSLAAFAMASTSRRAMSPSITSSSTQRNLAAAGTDCGGSALSRERGRLDPDDPGDVRRQPPVPAAEELHRAGDEERADDRDVDQDRRCQPEPELLQPEDRAD